MILGVVVFVSLGVIANKKFDIERKASQTEKLALTGTLPDGAPGAVEPDLETAPEGTDKKVTPAETPLPKVDPRPQATAVIGTEKVKLISEAAKVGGIDLVGIQTVVGGAFISLTWTGEKETHGQEFLETLQQTGLISSISLDESEEDYRFDKGQQLWTARYRVSF